MFSIYTLLLVGSVVAFVLVMLSIRKSKMRIEDAIFWVVLSLLVLLLGIFPQVGSAISNFLGFQSPISFIYLFFIFILLAKVFSLSRQVSELETKLQDLSQNVAVARLERTK